MQYFEHSTNASNDVKIAALRLMEGGAAVDCYWTILEEIYGSEEGLELLNQTETKSVTALVLANKLSVSDDVFNSWISSMLDLGLLVVSGDGKVTSDRAERNIAAYQARAEIARQNGKKGGRPKAKNQEETRSVTDGFQENNPGKTQSKANKTKQNKSIGSHKENQILEAGGASAADAAPPTSCPNCGNARTWKDSLGAYHCDQCVSTWRVTA